MITAQAAISRTRRDLTLAALVRWTMIGIVVFALFGQSLLDRAGITAMTVLMVVLAGWLVLSFRSVRGSRMAADSGSLIAAGQFDLAEQQIAQAIQSFSIFRTMKLMSLHRLAMLRHAQSRWQEAALLSRALLTQKPAARAGLDGSSRLILAESLLELGDVQGAYENIGRLYEQRLSLREALRLMSVQLDYQARVGAWDQMIQQIATKVQMAELLPTAHAARAQAQLALAARKTGRADWSDWLRRRVELLVPVEALRADRPMLAELWNAA